MSTGITRVLQASECWRLFRQQKQEEDPNQKPREFRTMDRSRHITTCLFSTLHDAGFQITFNCREIKYVQAYIIYVCKVLRTTLLTLVNNLWYCK